MSCLRPAGTLATGGSWGTHALRALPTLSFSESGSTSQLIKKITKKQLECVLTTYLRAIPILIWAFCFGEVEVSLI